VSTAWINSKLIFRHSPMDEIIGKLSRRFNVEIELRDKEIRDYKYSATFTTESIDEILYLLTKSAPIEYQIIDAEQDENRVYLKRKIIIRRR
jgi:ferric-dicitrate binding protein FerR (iron transport regulator)